MQILRNFFKGAETAFWRLVVGLTLGAAGAVLIFAVWHIAAAFFEHS